ncbi:MAG TPA: hypothetical protein VK283_13940, partial [Acidimicrobiales bacterium]|nr:hypothetical protein [Acidimicrobiales bacterium]
MATTLLNQSDGGTRPTGSDSRPGAELDGEQRAPESKSRRHLGVRLLLTLVVLLPMLATGILIVSSAASALRFRQNAEVVA